MYSKLAMIFHGRKGMLNAYNAIQRRTKVSTTNPQIQMKFKEVNIRAQADLDPSLKP